MLQAFCKESCSERYSELLYLLTDLFPWGLVVNKHGFFLLICFFYLWMTVSHGVQVAECKLFLPAGRVHEAAYSS